MLGGPWGDDRGGEILIVPGGDLTNSRMAGVTSYWRSVYAVFTWQSGHYKEMVISGHDVAPVMRDFIAAYGVPQEAILVEDKSTSTRENALDVAELLRNDSRRKVLLTSDYHMFRAARAFRKAGLEVTAFPFPDAQKRANSIPERWTVFCMLVAETAKVLYYGARGWI